MFKKIIGTVFGLIVIVGIIGAMGGDETSSTSGNAVSTSSSTITATIPSSDVTPVILETPKIKQYKNGTYLVGEDIEGGLYKATISNKAMNMGYVERSKDLKKELDSIIANIALTGNGYVEILDTDMAVTVQGVILEKINLEELTPNLVNEATDGIYLVGYDLAPGTYKVEVTNTITNMGYIQRSKSVGMGFDDIIANEIVQGPSYIDIADTDFAVQLQGVKISKK